MWGRAARRTAVSARSAAAEIPPRVFHAGEPIARGDAGNRDGSARGLRHPAARPQQQRRGELLPHGAQFPRRAHDPSQPVPRLPLGHADPRPVRQREIPPRRRPRGDRRGAGDSLRHPPQEPVPAEPGGGEEQVARPPGGAAGDTRTLSPAPRKCAASSSVHPGIIPQPTTAGTPASRNTPSISRRSSAAIVPSPIVTAGIPHAAQESRTGFSYSADGTHRARHRVDPLEEAGQLQRFPDVRHRPSALRGEGLRQPLRVADVVVDEDQLADVVAAGEQDGGRASDEPRRAEEERSSLPHHTKAARE